ncbi:Secretory carrier-associated membrane protein 3 [Smittium culicis]|uniref:Secretory carrier-associated membrane protein 3 n=1 Tax=Smittium culicis TaxID=133412 RepID=A0A1R1YM06_9FUNG|nr:Secretory carrier-associated membrane protein 3 [Smittium culicis]
MYGKIQNTAESPFVEIDMDNQTAFQTESDFLTNPFEPVAKEPQKPTSGKLTSNESFGNFSGMVQGGGMVSDVDPSSDMLRKKERELAEMEMNLKAQARVLEEERLELQQESERLRQQANNVNLANPPAGFRPAKNFPPFYPMIYHNISAEIGVADQKAVLMLFKLWLGVSATLLFNVISCLLLMIISPKNFSPASDFIWSIIYVISIIPSSFFLWYRPVYNAYMKDSALLYFIFFIFNSFNVLYFFYMCVGFSGSGSAGLINLIISASNANVINIVFCSIPTASLFAVLFFNIVLLKKTHSHYKTRGHSFRDAKNQAYVGFASRAVAS